MKNCLPVLFLLGALPALGQRLDHYDLLLFNISTGADSTWRIGTPRFLTDFNRKGYNNQPNFFSGNELYLTAQLPEDTTQTDLFALDLGLRTRTRVTATAATAEYSPTPMPGGKRFSAVRVEEDGVQRLWSFPLDRSDNGRPEFAGITGVGYHCWINDTLAGLFIVGQDNNPHTLYTAGVKGQKKTRVAANVGRALATMPGNRMAYVVKVTDQTWFLKIWDVKKQTSDMVVKMPAGVEDFAVLPDGTFFCGQNSKLYQYKAGRQTDWKEIADLSKYGVQKITRLAVHRDGKLVVVVTGKM